MYAEDRSQYPAHAMGRTFSRGTIFPNIHSAALRLKIFLFRPSAQTCDSFQLLMIIFIRGLSATRRYLSFHYSWGSCDGIIRVCTSYQSIYREVKHSYPSVRPLRPRGSCSVLVGVSKLTGLDSFDGKSKSAGKKLASTCWLNFKSVPS
jgi:hypothetical protein